MPILRDQARQLRRNQTDVEKKLWSRLRARQIGGAKFRRQYPIGHFIVDFCCFEGRLVVELDGGQHVARSQANQQRSSWIVAHGYRVLRFWENEVIENINAVLERIADALNGQFKQPSPFPLPKSEGKDITRK